MKGPFLSLPCCNADPWGSPFPTNHAIVFQICVLRVFVTACMFSIVRQSIGGEVIALGRMSERSTMLKRFPMDDLST